MSSRHVHGQRQRAARPARGQDPGQSQDGVTLVEVMLALAIVAVALVGMMAEIASNIRATQEATLRGVAVDLLRAKMYDVEAELIKDGFQDLDQSSEGDFSDEGRDDMTWEAKVEKIELPGLNALQTFQQAGDEAAQAAASGNPLVDLMAGFTGGLGSDSAAGASFIASQFDLLSQVLEASIRKVTVTVRWTVGKEEHEMLAAVYLTDPSAMDKVLSGLGAEAPSEAGTPGSGGSGSDGRGGSGGSGGTPGRGSPGGTRGR